MRKTGPIAAILAISLIVAGCTIDEMRTENVRREQQVVNKEIQLQNAQQTQRQLQAEHQNIVRDLKTRELTVNELKKRLDEIQRLNAKSVVDTPKQQQDKAVRQQRLSEAADQIKAVERDSTSSQEAKAKRLDDVRQQLRKTLELLAIP